MKDTQYLTNHVNGKGSSNGKEKKAEEKEPNKSRPVEGRPVICKIEDYLKKRYEFRNNVIANRIEYRLKGEGKFIEFNDSDLHIQLLKEGFKFGKQLIESLFKSSFVPKYDPFRDYFARLPEWDMQRDHIVELANHVKASDQERFNLHFKKALVRSIACALEYDFNKQAIILIGKQNDGKSTFIRSLCPPMLKEYIKEDITPDKHGRISLAQNFIINLDELATLDKTEINKIKSMFSTAIVKERPVYGSRDIVMTRRASFWGSTNHTQFLTDETGSVRWLCFEIESIDFNYQQDVDINKVYSQAFYLFNHKFSYKLTPEEIAENEIINKSYQVYSDEMNLIMKYYQPGTSTNHDAFYTTTDFIEDLQRRTENRIRLNSNTLGKALRMLDFFQESRRTEKYTHPVKGYFVNYNKITS